MSRNAYIHINMLCRNGISCTAGQTYEEIPRINYYMLNTRRVVCWTFIRNITNVCSGECPRAMNKAQAHFNACSIWIIIIILQWNSPAFAPKKNNKLWFSISNGENNVEFLISTETKSEWHTILSACCDFWIPHWFSCCCFFFFHCDEYWICMDFCLIANIFYVSMPFVCSDIVHAMARKSLKFVMVNLLLWFYTSVRPEERKTLIALNYRLNDTMNWMRCL